MFCCTARFICVIDYDFCRPSCFSASAQLSVVAARRASLSSTTRSTISTDTSRSTAKSEYAFCVTGLCVGIRCYWNEKKARSWVLGLSFFLAYRGGALGGLVCGWVGGGERARGCAMRLVVTLNTRGGATYVHAPCTRGDMKGDRWMCVSRVANNCCKCRSTKPSPLCVHVTQMCSPKRGLGVSLYVQLVGA